MPKDKKPIGEYTILRVLLTLLVVVGHCYYYTIKSNYGGIDYGSSMSLYGVQDTFAHRLADIITTVIYTFHMPMFIALSGALFEFGHKKSVRETIIGKGKRLLIPFLVVTTLYAIPLKYLADYWSQSTNILKDIFIGQYLIQGNTHLWFLPTLFLEFVFFAIIYKFENKHSVIRYVLLAIAIVCTALHSKIPIILFSRFAQYLLWFYVGILFERRRTKLNQHFNMKALILLFVIWVGILFTCKYTPSDSIIAKIISSGLCILRTFSGMLFFYTLCYVLSKTSIRNWKPIQLLSRHSFGIYLYSDSLNYIILYGFVSLFSIQALGNETASILLYLSRLFITLFVALGISAVIKKTKIKYIS